MATQKDLSQFLDNAGNAQKLNDLVDDIREATIDYQVRTSEGQALIPTNLRLRLPYSGISITTLVDYL